MVGDMRTVSDDFYNFIQVVKDSLYNSDENKYLKEVSVKSNKDSIITMTDYQIMDKSQILDEYLFNGDIYTENGNLFLEKYINFPLSLNNIIDQITQKENSSEKETKINFDFNSVKVDLSNRFKYSEKIITSEGTELSFLNYNFEGFPMIASISKLTKIQSDIRYIENKVLTEILNAVQNKGLNFNTFQTLLETTKPVYYTTDVIDAAVVMGKKDEGFKPDEVELFFNGIPLRSSEFRIESGKVVLNKRITSPGTYALTGTISKRNADTQELVPNPVNQSIVVIREPTSAVISADNMRVFYRKLQNPTSISIPGVADNTIVPSSNGGIFKKTSSGWKVTPTTNDSIMKIKVSGELNNQTKIFDGGEFRVKNPPDGIGSIDVNGNYSTDGKDLTKLFINNGIITGTKPKDFDYKYEIVVTSFDVKVGRLPVQNVNGNRVNRNAAAVDDVESQPSGTPIRFQNIKAKTIDGDVVNDGYIIMPFTIFIRWKS